MGKLILNKRQLMQLRESGAFTCPTDSGEHVEVILGDAALTMLRRPYGPLCSWPIRPECKPSFPNPEGLPNPEARRRYIQKLEKLAAKHWPIEGE